MTPSLNFLKDVRLKTLCIFNKFLPHNIYQYLYDKSKESLSIDKICVSDTFKTIYFYSITYDLSSVFAMRANVLFYLVYVLNAFVNCVNGEISEYKTVTTLNGDVRGHLKQTLFQNVSYYAFLGIPYAEKPIDNLRFQV